MQNQSLVTIVAILAILVMGVAAEKFGFDGNAFLVIIATISGLAGYHLGTAVSKINPPN